MTPSEQVFSDAAREAAAKMLRHGPGDMSRAGAAKRADTALAAAVDADPRAKACLKLAALSDEEIVGRMAAAMKALWWKPREGAALVVPTFDELADVALAALGLPVAEQEGHDA